MDQRRVPGTASDVQAIGCRIEPSNFQARRGARRGRTGDLHVCPACASDLVYPIDWELTERRRWSVNRRCPECGWAGRGVHGQPAVDRFDEALDRGTEQMLSDLKVLTLANIEDAIDRFVAALAQDQILPEDF